MGVAAALKSLKDDPEDKKAALEAAKLAIGKSEKPKKQEKQTSENDKTEEKPDADAKPAENAEPSKPHPKTAKAQIPEKSNPDDGLFVIKVGKK